MKPEFAADKSIYLQIAENIEDDILQKIIDEESQVPSTNQLAAAYRINPATAAKGINRLVSDGILYKKRGIGMFVSTGALQRIRLKRKDAFVDKYIVPLLQEAMHLGMSKDEVNLLIKQAGEGET